MNRRSFLRNILAAAVAPAFLPSAVASIRPAWKKNPNNIFVGWDNGSTCGSITSARICHLSESQLKEVFAVRPGDPAFDADAWNNFEMIGMKTFDHGPDFYTFMMTGKILP